MCFFSILIRAFANFENFIIFHWQAFIVYKNGENLKMLIEIALIGNSFVKIISTKVNSKPCQAAEVELFPQIFTGFRGELKILLYI